MPTKLGRKPMTRKIERHPGAAIATATALFLTGPAMADILIVSSTAPELKPGMQIADSARLEVPAGAKVRVLLPSGATLAINGPASRAVKDVTKGEPLVESVWAKARELFETGGVDQSRPGATRGAAVSGPGETPVFAWNVIAAAANGTVCVERGAPLKVARPDGGRAAEITLIDTAGNARAKLTWPEGASEAVWPASLSPRADTVYQVITTGQPVRSLRLRLIDKSDTGEERALRTLIDNDCRQQARAWAQSGLAQ